MTLENAMGHERSMRKCVHLPMEIPSEIPSKAIALTK